MQATSSMAMQFARTARSFAYVTLSKTELFSINIHLARNTNLPLPAPYN